MKSANKVRLAAIIGVPCALLIAGVYLTALVARNSHESEILLPSDQQYDFASLPSWTSSSEQEPGLSLENRGNFAVMFQAADKQYLMSTLIAIMSMRRSHHLEKNACSPNEMCVDPIELDMLYDVLIVISLPLHLTEKEVSILQETFAVIIKQPRQFTAKDGKGRYTHSFDKFHIFTFTEYKKILFVDSDIIVVRDFLDVFAYKTPACVTHPMDDIFQSRTVCSTAFWMITPNMTMSSIIRNAVEHGSYDDDMRAAADVFRWEWNILPRAYLLINHLWESRVLEVPARRNSMNRVVKVFHFSSPKPWQIGWFMLSFSPTLQYYDLWYLYRDYLQTRHPMIYNILAE
jgi:hypothetical protein